MVKRAAHNGLKSVQFTQEVPNEAKEKLLRKGSKTNTIQDRAVEENLFTEESNSRWQNDDAVDCKSSYAGLIPARLSMKYIPEYECKKCTMVFEGIWKDGRCWHPKECPYCKNIYFTWLNYALLAQGTERSTPKA